MAWGLAPGPSGRQPDNEGKSDSGGPRPGPGGKPPTELSLLGSPKLEGSLSDSLSPHTMGTDDELPSDPPPSLSPNLGGGGVEGGKEGRGFWEGQRLSAEYTLHAPCTPSPLALLGDVRSGLSLTKRFWGNFLHLPEL